MKTDSVDEQIVRLLGQDGRQTSEQIAKHLKLSAATVRRRIKRLVENDILHFVGVVNPADFNQPIFAVVALTVETDKLLIVAEKLRELPEVKWLETTVGHFDLIAAIRCTSMDDFSLILTDIVNKIDGIKDSETFISLNRKKLNYIPLT